MLEEFEPEDLPIIGDLVVVMVLSLFSAICDDIQDLEKQRVYFRERARLYNTDMQHAEGVADKLIDVMIAIKKEAGNGKPSTV